MKKNKFIFNVLCISVLLGAYFSFIKPSTISQIVEAANEKPTEIDLNDNTEQEIRNYYSYLNNLPASERRGTNLLKNLKHILVNNPSNPTKSARYFTYGQVRSIYNITDRQWRDSKASSIPGYNAVDNTITGYSYDENPYLYFYYRSDNFTNPHFANATVSSKAGASMVLLNQEHLWSVSHGFKGAQNYANAATDLHHLVAADGPVNKFGHSNYTYGYVDVPNPSSVTSIDNWDNGANAILGNVYGTAKTIHAQDESNRVFEPQDIDKGDIARALFYMAARYNYYGDDASKASIYEPELQLVDFITDEEETHVCDGTNGPGRYGILSDLLEWHVNDMVTADTDTGYYEIHRNNLIYNNYQYTRNPFIDFPQWVDYIWGDQKETGVASPLTDDINGYHSSGGEVTSISLNVTELELGKSNSFQAKVDSVSPSSASKAVTWSSSNENIVEVSSSGLITGVNDGSAIITATSVSNPLVSKTISVTIVTKALTGFSFAENAISISANTDTSLDYSFSPIDSSDKNMIWTSSDPNIATVNNGVVTGHSAGYVTITATSVTNPNISDSMDVFVTSSVETKYSYKMITSNSELTTGDYIIADSNTHLALNGSGSKSVLTASNNTVSVDGYYDLESDAISSNETTDILKFHIDVTNHTIMSDSGLYIGHSGSSAGLIASDSTIYTNTISINSNGDALIYSSTSNYKLSLYSGATIKYYKASSATLVKLYKYSPDTSITIKQSFKMINSLNDVTTGMYVIGAKTSDGQYYMMQSDFPSAKGKIGTDTVSLENDSISLLDAQNHIVYIKANGSSLSISNSSLYVNSAESGTDLLFSQAESSWTCSYKTSTKGTFTFTSNNSLVLAMFTSSKMFGNYSPSAAARHIELFKYYEEEVSDYTKELFANDILTGVVCDGGVSTPTFSEGYSWTILENKFNNLTTNDKDYIKNIAADESSSDVVAKAMAKYDLLVRKYSDSKASFYCKDFIDRGVSSTNIALLKVNKNNIALILTICSVIGLSFIGVLLIKKKRIIKN